MGDIITVTGGGCAFPGRETEAVGEGDKRKIKMREMEVGSGGGVAHIQQEFQSSCYCSETRVGQQI